MIGFGLVVIALTILALAKLWFDDADPGFGHHRPT